MGWSSETARCAPIGRALEGAMAPVYVDHDEVVEV